MDIHVCLWLLSSVDFIRFTVRLQVMRKSEKKKLCWITVTTLHITNLQSEQLIFSKYWLITKNKFVAPSKKLNILLVMYLWVNLNIPTRHQTFHITSTYVTDKGWVEIVSFILQPFSQHATQLWEFFSLAIRDQHWECFFPVLDECTVYNALPVTVYHSWYNLEVIAKIL